MTIPQTTALFAGLAVLVAAWGWAAVRRRRVREHIVEALAHIDPDVRCAALDLAAQAGLRRFAPVLLRVAQEEPDVHVRSHLVQVLGRYQWVPATTVALVQLRLWAAGQIQGLSPEVPGSRQAVEVVYETGMDHP